MCYLWRKLISSIPCKELHSNSDGIYRGKHKKTLCRDLDLYMSGFAKKAGVETPSSVDTIFYSKKSNALCFVEFKDAERAKYCSERNIEKEERNTILLKAFSTLFVLMQENEDILKELFLIEKRFFLFYTTSYSTNAPMRQHYRKCAEDKSKKFPFHKHFQLSINIFDEVMLEEEAIFGSI